MPWLQALQLGPIQIAITSSDAKEKQKLHKKLRKKPCVCYGLQVKNVTSRKRPWTECTWRHFLLMPSLHLTSTQSTRDVKDSTFKLTRNLTRELPALLTHVGFQHHKPIDICYSWQRWGWNSSQAEWWKGLQKSSGWYWPGTNPMSSIISYWLYFQIHWDSFPLVDIKRRELVLIISDLED